MVSIPKIYWSYLAVSRNFRVEGGGEPRPEGDTNLDVAHARDLGEAQRDLKQALHEETGREVDVDREAFMDIVPGNRLWPPTFDFEGGKTRCDASRREIAVASWRVADAGPVERARGRLLAMRGCGPSK